jgi:hypothetical protein
MNTAPVTTIPVVGSNPGRRACPSAPGFGFAPAAEYHRGARRARHIDAAGTGDGILDSTATVIILMVVLIIYMLPTLIAYGREHPWRHELAIINIFLGWTLIGWFVVFLWAALGAVEEQPA